jgi:hypothetical protein
MASDIQIALQFPHHMPADAMKGEAADQRMDETLGGASMYG